ncbi:caspase family protein [Streptomyces sp. NPDC048420]|uniref:nSTAND1 domain-containing NTPase n=1 Tax=Streptomyces sp. NPDC048420 TaxID=3155755 RepID=UPI00344733B0
MAPVEPQQLPWTPAAPGARRFLISTAVTDVRAHPEAERPELADDLRRIDDLLMGDLGLGYVRGADLGLNPTREALVTALRAFATAPERRPDDHVVLYLAAHGVTAENNGRHYLLLHDSDARDLRGTALPTEDLVSYLWEDTAVERLLVLLDACYAEEGTDKALRRALEDRRFREPVTEHGSTGLVLVASSRRKEETYTGALSSAFDRAVRRWATAGHAPAHISLDQVMAAIAADAEVPPAQRPVWSLTHATGDIPAFLPNPRYVPDAAGLKLDEIDRIVGVGARERDAREQDMRGFFLPRARGTDVSHEEVWDFTGRHVALGDVTTWLDPRRTDERLCVVTGDPGSGKSSLLGMVAVLTDPDRGPAVPREGLPALLPRSGDIDVRVNASHLSNRQLLDALSAAAGCAADSLGALTTHLQTRARPLVVLVDSLDEALAPHEAVDEILAPLTDPARRLPLRLLVGARPHIAARLRADAPRIDLDSERHSDPDAVRAYVRKLLCAPASVLRTAEPDLVDDIAEAVAEAADRSFLVARITARTLAREPHPPDPHDLRWREKLPRLPGQAMERDLVQRLGPLAARARELLLPLAYAQGAGLPWAGVWSRLAAALTGRDYGDEDVVWLRQAAGSYVVESVEAGGSVYRVYHRALIEYLREGRDSGAVQRTITEVLRGIEHPYVRRYLALHASEGAVLDPLVQDAGFVLGAEPGRLLAALPGLRSGPGRRAGQAIRDLEEELRRRQGKGPDPEGRARLRLAAVCRKAQVLAESCDVGEEGLPWRARWAAWNSQAGERRYDGMSIGVNSGVVVPGERGARFLDLARENGPRWVDLDDGGVSRAHAAEVSWRWGSLAAVPQLPDSAAGMYFDRQFVLEKGDVVAGDAARLLHLWQGARLRTWLLPPHPAVDAAIGWGLPQAADQLAVLAGEDGSPAAAAMLFSTGHLLVYRLGSTPAYRPLTRRERRRMWAWRAEYWDGRSDQLAADCDLVLSPGTHGHITACVAPRDLRTGSLLLGHADGRIVQFSTLSQETEAETVTGHEGRVTEVALVRGHPLGRLVATAGSDGTVRLSSLTTGGPVRTLLTSAFVIASLAVHRVGHQWIVAAVTADGQLHRVDLDSGRPIGLPLPVDRVSVKVETFDLGSSACVSVRGHSRGVQLYDLVTGERLGGQILDHAANALCRVGGTVCVGGSDGIVRLWPTPDAADSTHVTAHEAGLLALGEIHGPSGASALVSVGQDHVIRCWDLGRPHELWRRRVPIDRGRWATPLMSCAAVGHTSDGRDFVATGEYRGHVRILVLRAGLPVAEQEFTVPDTLTALTTGRVRGRDVLVVGTGSGRIVCWDVGGGRMYVYGPCPDTETWTTALALAPDGSGNLAVGGLDGSVREWSLPTCRPLGPARAAHRGLVRALAYTPSGLVGCGVDTRLVAYADGWERRMPQPVAALHLTDDGLLCGDDRGHIWSLREGPEGRRVVEALDAVRSVTATAAVPVEDGLVVVTGSGDGSLQIREAQHGTLVRRLRQVGESGVAQLATVSRTRLLARCEDGLLQYWDFDEDGPLASEGSPIVLPLIHERAETRLTVLADGDGTESLLSLTFPDGKDGFGVYDVTRGRPLVDRLTTARPSGDTPWAVRCAGTVLLLVTVGDGLVHVFDTATERWAALSLPGDWLLDVFSLPGPGREELLLISDEGAMIVPGDALSACFTLKGGLRTRQRRPVILRGLLRRSDREPIATHEHEIPFYPSHCALFPDSERYVLSDGPHVAVLGSRTGEILRRFDLPSPCTALAIGPHGELIVGTGNGVILFD